MDGPAGDPNDESIGDLFGRAIDEGRAYAKAEIDLYRQIALHRAGRARTGLIALASGAVLLLTSLTALVLGLVLGLALWIGPLLAGLAIAALLALAGYLLIRFGVSGLKALAGEEGERRALDRGEKEP